MPLPRVAWGWWGDEGGRRLDVERLENGRVVFTASSGQQEERVSVTLANFRVPQLRDWLLEPSIAGERDLLLRLAKAAHKIDDEIAEFGQVVSSEHFSEFQDALIAVENAGLLR